MEIRTRGDPRRGIQPEAVRFLYNRLVRHLQYCRMIFTPRKVIFQYIIFTDYKFLWIYIPRVICMYVPNRKKLLIKNEIYFLYCEIKTN